MALLTLKDIGKIYVSEGSVSVGIRGVNLSFNKGEFVAVTGKSGSGKSTLLNVISGMDTYEEGELFIEDQPTSHYMQQDWEEYREKYISFIFQDYNIIESFTVLQNVELALMHIEDKKARRKRAMELLDRVGLSAQIKQKGSKLSGGQKQRTVIARALAKDSPIILADEPTGNLDAATSAEIIELLKEVSKDKLLIVVTHNFEQVENHATRHIRIFDGAVESDHKLRAPQPAADKNEEETEKKEYKGLKKQVKNGIILGKSIFTAKPKLSIFICLLLIVGTLGVFLMTSICGSAGAVFEPQYMFTHIDGRVILAKQNADIITEEELESLAEKYGAKSVLHYDMMLDMGTSAHVMFPVSDIYYMNETASLNYTFGKKYDGKIIGRYPEKTNEVLLYLPISLQPIVGKDSIKLDRIVVDSIYYDLVGVKYFYDNNLTGECLFTEEGFRFATAIHYLMPGVQIKVNVLPKKGVGEISLDLYNLVVSFDLDGDKIYLNSEEYNKLDHEKYVTNVVFMSEYYKFDYNYSTDGITKIFTYNFTDENIVHEMPPVDSENLLIGSMIASDEVICKIADKVLGQSYAQASLFFENDEKAHKVAEKLKDEGYVAVASDTTYEPDSETTLMTVIMAMFFMFLWVMSIVFLAFFINLCLGRTLGAFKGDMAIMRSMGISVKVIRIGMYVRMLISLVPAYIFMAIGAFVVFTTPVLNGIFNYLYAGHYVMIFIGMILLTIRITQKQIKRLFGQSVKKALRGEEKND